MEQVASTSPTGGTPQSGGKSKLALIGGLAVVAVAVAFGMRGWRSVSNTNANTNAAEPGASPAVAGVAVEPAPEPMVPTVAGRQTVGSTSIEVPAGLLMRDSPQLDDVFGRLGVSVVTARTFSNLDPDEFAPRVQSGQLSLQEALGGYWRLDILELTNPNGEDLDGWLKRHWPDAGTAEVEITDREGSVGGTRARIQELKHMQLGLAQQVHFTQPAPKGNIVVLSSFQGEAGSFSKEIGKLLASVKFFPAGAAR